MLSLWLLGPWLRVVLRLLAGAVVPACRNKNTGLNPHCGRAIVLLLTGLLSHPQPTGHTISVLWTTHELGGVLRSAWGVQLNYFKPTYAKALFVCVGCECDRALHNQLPLFSCARSFWPNPLQRFQPGIASYLRHQDVTGWTVVASPRIVSQTSILHEPSPTTPHNTTPTSTIMGPYIFFRVEDEDSRARYSDEEGLFAEDTDTWVNFKRWDRRLLG